MGSGHHSFNEPSTLPGAGNSGPLLRQDGGDDPLFLRFPAAFRDRARKVIARKQLLMGGPKRRNGAREQSPIRSLRYKSSYVPIDPLVSPDPPDGWLPRFSLKCHQSGIDRAIVSTFPLPREKKFPYLLELLFRDSAFQPCGKSLTKFEVARFSENSAHGRGPSLFTHDPRAGFSQASICKKLLSEKSGLTVCEINLT